MPWICGPEGDTKLVWARSGGGQGGGGDIGGGDRKYSVGRVNLPEKKTQEWGQGRNRKPRPRPDGGNFDFQRDLLGPRSYRRKGLG